MLRTKFDKFCYFFCLSYYTYCSHLSFYENLRKWWTPFLFSHVFLKLFRIDFIWKWTSSMFWPFFHAIFLISSSILLGSPLAFQASMSINFLLLEMLVMGILLTQKRTYTKKRTFIVVCFECVQYYNSWCWGGKNRGRGRRNTRSEWEGRDRERSRAIGKDKERKKQRG